MERRKQLKAVAAVTTTPGIYNGGIYTITNTITGEQYVGSTIDLKGREAAHRANARNRRGYGLLGKAFKQYEAEAFVFEVLKYGPREALAIREAHYIDLLKPVYNLMPAADNKRRGTGISEPVFLNIRVKPEFKQAVMDYARRHHIEISGRYEMSYNDSSMPKQAIFTSARA